MTGLPSLHPDWPATDLDGYTWDLPDPLSDFVSALEAGQAPFHLDDLATVERYSITSNSGEWKPGADGIATELSLCVVGTLKDGRWFAVEAWNDYTGWGCQDGSDVYVGSDEADVVARGMTNSMRLALGYPEVSA